jgi:hypothetical protein
VSIYLAARYTRRVELCGYREELWQRGIDVTSRWLNGSHQLSDIGTPIGDAGELLVETGDQERADALRRKFATDDIEDVLAADELVAFTEVPRTSNSRGGRHVELGIALGAGRRVTVIGPRENVFCWLPQVRHFDSWPEYLGALAEAGGAARSSLWS